MVPGRTASPSFLSFSVAPGWPKPDVTLFDECGFNTEVVAAWTEGSSRISSQWRRMKKFFAPWTPSVAAATSVPRGCASAPAVARSGTAGETQQDPRVEGVRVPLMLHCWLPLPVSYLQPRVPGGALAGAPARVPPQRQHQLRARCPSA